MTPAVRTERGLRYARARRFALPVLEALGPDRLTAPAPQPGATGAEDCLHLTVWSPADIVRAPVLVWIHGGAHVRGSSTDPVTNGARLAEREGLVVVAVQYRLGALGHLFVGDEVGGAPDAGNAALHDQIAALRWVRANIACFGGDPDEVTIMGQSSGGVDVMALLAAVPGARLFRRAIAQSCTAERVLTPSQAEQVRDQLLQTAGLSSTGALRELPIDELLAAQSRLIERRSAVVAVDSLPFRPVVDGRLLHRRPVDSLAAGAGSDVPLLIGANRHEALPWVGGGSDHERTLRATVRSVAPRALAAGLSRALERDRGRVPSAGELLEAVLSEVLYRAPVDRIVAARRGAPTYTYVFDPAGVDGVDAGHSGELPLVFGTVEHPAPGAARLSQRMMAAWGSFAREGCPSSEPDWHVAERGVFGWGAEPRLLPASDPHLRAELARTGAVCDRL